METLAEENPSAPTKTSEAQADAPPLGCPVCQREFELPRRYRIKSDDLDYLVLPRVLNCLHTSCHSCSEEVFQRNDGNVICPICRRSQKCKGVKYLPLDVSVLTEIVQTGGAMAMAYCCRCHDETPSFSWCFSCHSPLCEFHHQDHKLSINTKCHMVSTLKEISEEKYKIEPQLPPIACPEALGNDCTLLCKTCGYMISAQAMVENHKGHNIVDANTIFGSCREMMSSGATEVQKKIGELMMSVDLVNETLQQLEEETENTSADIDFHFKSLRQTISDQESAMRRKLDDISSRKRTVLTEQLDALSDALDNCRTTHLKAESILEYNEKSTNGLSRWALSQV